MSGKRLGFIVVTALLASIAPPAPKIPVSLTRSPPVLPTSRFP
jgi:hypothetical protein